MDSIKVKNDSFIIQIAKQWGGLGKYHRRTDTCSLALATIRGLVKIALVIAVLALVAVIVCGLLYCEWKFISHAFLVVTTDQKFNEGLSGPGTFAVLVNVAILVVASIFLAVAMLMILGTYLAEVPRIVRHKCKGISLSFTLFKSIKEKTCVQIDITD